MIDLIYSNRNVPFTPKRAIIELPMTLRCPTGFTKWQWGWHIGIKAESYRGTLLWISTKQLSCIMRLVSVVTRVQETFFFSSILMSNHFLFTSLNPINLFCTSASRFWIFTLLTDTYVYWHRQTSQNNFHSNLWERLFFLQFIRHFLCVSFAFYGGVLCASPNEIRYAVHTAGNLRVIDIQQHTHAWTNKISISGSHFEFRKLNLPQNWQMRTFFINCNSAYIVDN